MYLSAPKRVVMLTCQFMPDVYGGAEKQCMRLSTGLASRGHSITVLTSTQKKTAPKKENIDGVNIRRLYTSYPPDLLGRWAIFSFLWLIQVLLWGWKNRRDFDVIHCHQGKYGGFVAYCLSKITGKPFLIKLGNSEQDMDLLCLKRKFLFGPLFYKSVVNSKAVFIAISQMIRKNLQDIGCRNIVDIPNGVPPATHLSQSVTHDNTEGEVDIFYHGRLEEIKNVGLLLEAFKLFLAGHTDVKLHIVGDGTELEMLRQQAQDLSLGDKVIFHGACADVLTKISEFDIFANTSRAEGFSNSLLEALVLGKVLVSTPVSGALDCIQEGENGFIASDMSPEGIALCLDKALSLYRDSSDKVEQFSNELVEQRFTMERIVDQYENLYAVMLGAKTSG